MCIRDSLVGAATVAGDLLGTQIGLSGAAVLDPTSGMGEHSLSQFATLFAIALLLALDAHLVMVDALGKSLRLIPVGTVVDATRGMHEMVRGASILFGLGLQFAAPVVATVLVANTALAVLGRAAPQLNVLNVAFPVQIGIGLFALAASIPFIGAFYNGWNRVYETLVTPMLGALASGGGIR